MNPGYIQTHYKRTGVFTSSWKTNNSGITTSTQIKLPLESTGSYKFYVDWGDGSTDFINTWNQSETTHTYSVAGTYTVKIRGLIIGWRFNDPNSNTTDSRKILTITRWGCLRLGNNGGYFSGCLNLTCGSITDILNLKGTNNLSNAFSFCEALTTIGRINEWNTSAVTTMQAMFDSGGSSQTGRGIFNQDIGNWDVSNVTNFSSMFHFALMFNNGGSDSIKNWNMSSATLTNDMFSRATRFNQPIGNWERTGSTMANVTNMDNMFSSGNPGLGFSFNQDIGNWNVSSVTSMLNMFYRSRFNYNLGSWNVSNVTNFGSMFSSNTVFNNGGSDSIKDWTIKTTGTVTMSSMFNGSIAFNQPLNWNTSAVTDMSNMFNGATAFKQYIGAWNVSNVTNFTNFMASKTAATFPSTYLDDIYNSTTGWPSRSVNPSINISFNTAEYTSVGTAGRAILTGSPNNWTITDVGPV
jgi:surface protein